MWYYEHGYVSISVSSIIVVLQLFIMYITIMTKMSSIVPRAVSVGLLVAVAIPALAQTTTSASMGQTTSASVSSKIQCVGAAVAVREQALDTAMTTYGSSVNAAYSARAAALSKAYADTTVSSLRSDIKAAWSAFAASMRSAHKSWMSARNGAWKQFRASARVCRAPAAASDNGSSGSEASGA